MAQPTIDPHHAGLPTPRRWRPGLALGSAVLVLWGHWWLIEALTPTGLRPGGPLRPVAALQVRRVTVPLPAPAMAAQPVAAPTVAATPVAPARPPAKLPAASPSDVNAAAALLRLADAPQRAAVPPVEPAGRADAEGAPGVGSEAPAAPEGDPPPVYPTRLPPPVQLRYALRYNGQAGEALLGWQHDGERYGLTLDGRGATGDRLLVAQTSQGLLDVNGLAPERHLDRRRGGRQQAANFRRDIGRIVFSGPALDYPAWPGAQDRLSWLAQLAAILGAGHAAPEVRLFVVDARGAGSLWQLQRQPDEWLPTPVGEVLSQLWQRDPPRPEGLKVQVWLDASRGHWPVQLRFTAQRSGDVFELSLLAEPRAAP